jgi:hypothetical protein
MCVFLFSLAAAVPFAAGFNARLLAPVGWSAVRS